MLALDLRGIKLIEASAGTGKTYAIGNLYLRLICDGYSVRQILVVTFTNAATDELRGRIRDRLYQAVRQLDGEPCNDDFLIQWSASLTEEQRTIQQLRLKLALRSMDESAIYTIHGFCQRALTEHAFNSRQAFDVEMITDDHQLWQDALKDWWRSRAYTLEPVELGLFTLALKRIGDLFALQEPLRQSNVQLLPENPSSLAELYLEWRNIAADWQELAALWQQHGDALVAIIEQSKALSRSAKEYKQSNLELWLPQWDEYFSNERWWMWPACVEKLAADALDQGSTKTKRGRDPDLNHHFFIACETWLHKVEQLRLRFLASALHDANLFAAERVALAKKQASLMSFHDQLVLLNQALLENEALGAALRQRFPIAMIDEFQDTDAIQYSIFITIYNHEHAHGLMMIGDPKQAIYSFRGGDIFTYMQAADDAEEHFTLDTNWRSTPELVTAVNSLFMQRSSNSFVYQDIAFHPVHAAESKIATLREDGDAVPAMHIWTLPDDAKGKGLSSTKASPLIYAHIAAEISRLISGGQQGDVLLGERGVLAGDIAVLVRNHFEGKDLRQALHRHGVSAVIAGKEKVFSSEEAIGLRMLLVAVLHHDDPRMLRQAIASSLLALDYVGMAAILHHEEKWLQWSGYFQKLHCLWQQRGFMPMFQRMLQWLEIGKALAAEPLAERRLTNVLHLAELLQQESCARPSIESLLVWYDQQEEHASEEAELRLETDEALVRIVTIHASKGLEYPIVFLPTLWGCKPRIDDGGLITFYDRDRKQRCLDIACSQQERKQHLEQAEEERLAEDIRLAYVALTRACSKLYVVWGHIGKNWQHTAINWLLHQGNSHNQEQMNQDLTTLVDHANGNISIQGLPLEQPEIAPVSTASSLNQICKPAVMQRTVDSSWTILSFSSLTRDLPAAQRAAATNKTSDPILAYPAGSQTGLFLHLLLEQLDFQHDIKPWATQFTTQHSLRFGLDPDQTELVSAWMQNVVATPLNDQGLCLRDIPKESRLNELSFDFPLGKLNPSALNAVLDGYSKEIQHPLSPGYFQGYMTGIIDLVFVHEERYYIADYKSNYLGPTLDDYAPASLGNAMSQHRYDLQYLIYTLALHRYLTLRLRGYDYNKHIGGVYYLFLRGMRPEQGSSHGIFADCPPFTLISTLEQQICGKMDDERMAPLSV